VAQWAKSTSAGNNKSIFNAVAADSSGNVYAAGYQYNKITYTYGTGVSAQGTSSYYNVVLVKYNSSGAAQWAQTVSSVAGGESIFNAVTVDSSGNVYAAGRQEDDYTYTYGAGVSAQGKSDMFENVVLVKYNSSGVAQWAKSTSSAGYGSSCFNAVAIDSLGSVYAAGYATGKAAFGSISAQGGYSGGGVLLVKFDSSGAAKWARTVTVASSGSGFNGVAVNSSGIVYAAGSQSGTGTFTYAGGISAIGTYSGDSNASLVQYK